MIIKKKLEENIYERIKILLREAKNNVIQTVNKTMVYTYFEIGRIIFENEQKGKERAEYGKETLKELSAKLNKEFGKGFSEDNLSRMRKFYYVYSQNKSINNYSNKISATPLRKYNHDFLLSWSHYLVLIRIDDEIKRGFYEKECTVNRWSLTEFKRQIDSALFERVALSKKKDEILRLSKEGQFIEKPIDIIKDPYVLEFLGLKGKNKFSENQLALF